MLVQMASVRTISCMAAKGRGLALAALLVGGGLLSAACGPLPVSQVYLSEKTYGLYLTLPKSFVALEAADSALTNPEGPPSYLRAFHGPDVQPEVLLGGPTPGGYVGMRVVDGDLEVAQTVAENSALTDLDQAVKAGQAQILAGPTVVEENESFVTTEWRISATLPGATESSTILQRATVGLGSASPVGQPESHVVKTLVIGCTSTCFANHTQDITRIIESWRFN